MSPFSSEPTVNIERIAEILDGLGHEPPYPAVCGAAEMDVKIFTR